MMEVPTPSIRKTWTCLTLTFLPADLTTFARLDELGLEVTGELLASERGPGFPCGRPG